MTSCTLWAPEPSPAVNRPGGLSPLPLRVVLSLTSAGSSLTCMDQPSAQGLRGPATEPWSVPCAAVSSQHLPFRFRHCGPQAPCSISTWGDRQVAWSPPPGRNLGFTGCLPLLGSLSPMSENCCFMYSVWFFLISVGRADLVPVTSWMEAEVQYIYVSFFLIFIEVQHAC